MRLISKYGWIRTLHVATLRAKAFMRAPWAGGVVLLACVVAAMLLANLPATIRAVAMSPLIDRLTVIDRDGGVLYDGADPDMFAGQWERGFHRPLSAVETADARMRLARIGSLRSVPGVGTALSDPVVASIRRSLDDLA